MKKTIIMLSFSLLAASCGGSETNLDPIPGNPTDEGHETIVNTITKGLLSLSLRTDKVCYKPGETVSFAVEGNIPSGAMVRYRNGAEVVSSVPISSNTWTWQTPAQDYCGYMVDIYTTSGNEETIYGTIAVDVSSDWKQYPRYGFVASYDHSKTQAVIEQEMAFLNRCHINGIQFYDWHNKHHWPLGGTREQLLERYTDIANREIVTNVVKRYIETQHRYGMKAMFYNLCYGALDDASSEGVAEQWYMFKQPKHTDKDVLTLSDSWKSNIYLLNPENSDWQRYLAERNDEVYANFDFDGFHIDQVGSRGTVYDYDGTKINLPRAFASFINAMKAAHPQKSLVMNAVANYGARQIANTANVDFLYNELWDGESKFSDLLTAKQANSAYSNQQLQTIFAAYMNYNKSSAAGSFNTAGVLLTDAVMFAIGAAHLELGDGHMLCHEYFPNGNLKMSQELQAAIVCYYDFLVAYETWLRGGGNETAMDITSSNAAITINAWPPQLKKVTAYCKDVNGKRVVHLLNFQQANSLSWRDMDGTMPTPNTLSDLALSFNSTEKVNKIWAATPDALGGAPQELSFKQENGVVTFTLPSLKYWTMLVIE
jgi:dextranase